MRPSLLLCLLLAGCTTSYGLTETDKGNGDDVDTDAAGGADIQITPPFLDFQTMPPGCESDPLLVTITNVGSDPLALGDLTIGGPARNAFSVDQPLKNLAPGEATEARVTFTPASLGVYDDTRLVITSNDADEETVEVGLEGEGANEITGEDLFVQAAPSGIDVLVVLDTSHTMEQDVEDLQVHFATFINSFLNLGLDFHLGVMPIDDDCPTFVGPIIDTSTPDPATAFQTLLDTDMCDDNEKPFNMLTEAFTPPLLNGANAGFLRPDANLAVVVFTDEPEQSGEILNPYQPGDFVRFLRSLKGGDASKVTFSGLVGPESVGGAANCLIRGNPALWNDRYQKAIRQTNGYVGNICDQRVQPFLALLQRTVSGLTYEFELKHTPTSSDTSSWTVTVDGVPVTQGWSYDPATQSIVFENAAVPGPGSQISVRYPHPAVGCE